MGEYLDQLRITPQGIGANTPEGKHVLDIHHRSHPNTRSEGDNVISIGFTSHYSAMRKQFGEHMVDGIAGENIIIEYARLDGNQQVQDVMDKGDEIYRQAALYCEIKAMLLYLAGAFKQEYVDRLNELGYNIDITNQESKIKSIQRNDRRANNISTRMQIIQKEIESYSLSRDKAKGFLLPDGCMDEER